VVPTRGFQPSAPAFSASSTAASSPSSHNLSFGGGIDGVGVTTGPPRVYLVFWGSQWGAQGTDSNGYLTLAGDTDGLAPYVQAFLAGLGTGGETWSGVMTQYCEGVAAGAQTCPASNGYHVGYPTGGALAGVWADESAPAPSQASAHRLAAEAVAAAEHFGNATTTSNRDAQYVVVSPTGTSPDGFNTPNSQFCAWHDYTADGTLDGGGAVTTPWGGPVAFTNLPYIPDAGSSCGEDFVNPGSAGLLDGVSIVEGHEYAETITDQFPVGGWLDGSSNENGDKCAWISSGQGASQDVTLGTGSFAVQSTWANDYNNGQGGCEISHPVVTDPTGNTVTVTDPGGQTSTLGVAQSLQISAADSASGQTLTYAATGLPTGLAIDPSSGLISGTPSTSGTWSVTVTATDTTAASGSASFTWTVGARSTSTSLSCSPSSLSTGSATTCAVTVSDSSAGGVSTPSGTVSFTASPAGGGAFSGSGGCTLEPASAVGSAGCQITYTPTATGTQYVYAGYGGDGNHSGSSTLGAQLSVAAPAAPSSSPTATSTAAAATSPPATITTLPAAPPSASRRVGCPAPRGRLSGSALGALALGMTRSQSRGAYPGAAVRPGLTSDLFCLTPKGIRAGYATSKLLRGLSAEQRRRLTGRVVWLTTANPYFSVGRLRAGTRLARLRGLRAALRHAVIVTSNGRRWYFLREAGASILLEVRRGVVQEVGIASRLLTRRPVEDRLLARWLS